MVPLLTILVLREFGIGDRPGWCPQLFDAVTITWMDIQKGKKGYEGKEEGKNTG